MFKRHRQKQNKCLLKDFVLEKVDAAEVCSDKDVLKNKPIIEQLSRSPISRSRSRIKFSHSSINKDTDATSCKIVSSEDKKYSPRKPRKLYSNVHDTVDHFDEICYLIRASFLGRRKSVFAHYTPLGKVKQQETTCGFAALAMASQLFTPSGYIKLFNEAKTLRITTIGEMFDAYQMARFASDQLNCESVVMCDLPTRKYDLLSHICDGWPVLIPYDQVGCKPGKQNGEKAHWAVLNGLFFSVGLTVDSGRQLKFISTSRGAYVKERLLYDCRRCTPDSDIFVLAREGTRSNLLAFRLDSLLESNRNLQTMSAKLGLTRSYELHNLRDKAVLLKKRSNI